MQQPSRIQPDTVFRDTGCHLHPSCLACPRAICIFDEPHPQIRRSLARRERARSLQTMGKEPAEIAEIMGISERRVYSYLTNK